jgi:hypothetical protein
MRAKWLCWIVALSFCAGLAQAGNLTFNLAWSGASLGNQASATGQITFDETLLPNPGFCGPTCVGLGNDLIAAIIDLTVTVSGAANSLHNGTFYLSDFNSVYWNTGGAPVGSATLDLSQELVGQAVTGSSSAWGDPNGSDNGDFNVFGLGGTYAPSGWEPFLLQAGGNKGGGEIMVLTSFAPAAAPEPGTLGLIGLSLAAAGLYFRRRA